jgi:hypothetical protein
MIRRRRRTREIPFSFDSFLDVVANVVGIIIRLILVAWVGARSYSSLSRHPRPNRSAAAPGPQVTAPALPDDPLQAELARRRHELEDAESRLLAQLQRLHLVQDKQTAAREHLGELRRREHGIELVGATLEKKVKTSKEASHGVVLSLEQLRRHEQKLVEQIRALEKLPPPTHQLRYHVPVSKPLEADEFFFECRDGRVTFIDIDSMTKEISDGIQDKAKTLRSQWQVTDVTAPVGAFRLRYTLEREHGMMDALAGAFGPSQGEAFRAAVTEWVVEPIDPLRGEDVRQALAPGSVFHQLADRFDPQQSAVTFWVYPDSFALFRQLRDYLYERRIVVAGRPLPYGVPIVCSRHGSVSRGQ